VALATVAALLAFLLTLLCMAPLAAGTAVPEVGRDYIVAGRATDQQAPQRACDAPTLDAMDQRVYVSAPPEGWSGAPQGVDVFNVFSGEVMIAHGDRRICGSMHDARTRDSRFRAGVGLVVVPPAGSHEPIRLAWNDALKERWIPTIRIGSPSDVQQHDTARLLIRAACLAIAIALALASLINFISARDRAFLRYTGICMLFLVWQSVLSGLSGYPVPWLPVHDAAVWWLLGLSLLCLGVLLPVLWWLARGHRCWPGSQRWTGLVGGVFALCGLLVPLLPSPALGWIAEAMDPLAAIVCLLAVVSSVIMLWRRDYSALAGLGASLPFLAMLVADELGSRLLIEYRIELLQIIVTWLLMIAAYALNMRLGRLRRQRDEMRLLADTDALTGLPNRRAGLALLETYLQKARTDGRPLSIGFVDIDLFKNINDQHGHATGDAVLVAVARALRTTVRSNADVIRMGGEEFLVLLPGTARFAAAARLEQLRLRVEAVTSELDRPGLSVTASLGLAVLRADSDDVAALLRRADHAMYRAKEGGRNQVHDGESLITDEAQDPLQA